MSVHQLPYWIVRCDVDTRHVHIENGEITQFYSYDTAVSLARLDGYRFDTETGITCPSCITKES